MHISAKTDYALRVLIELAAQDAVMTVDVLAKAQGIPVKYLSAVLTELRHRAFVTSHHGPQGGYRIRHPDKITVAEVIRATSGPLVTVRGELPEDLVYEGPASELSRVWAALVTAAKVVLDSVTIADLADKHLPANVAALADPNAS